MMIFHRSKTLIFQTFQNPLNLQKTHYDSVRLFVLSYSLSIQESSDRTEEISNVLQRHNFSPKNASKVASSLSSLEDAQKCDSMLTFLKDVGFSPPQLEKILLRKPKLLTSDLDRNIKPKIQVFQDLGFSSCDIAVIFAAYPEVFFQSLTNGIVPRLMTLKMVFGSIDEVSQVLKRFARILTYDLEKTMLPNLEHLKSCGIGTDQIMRVAHSVPRLLAVRPENMKRFVEKAEEMGCARHSKMFIYGVRTMSSMSDESLRQKLDLFRELGFSEDQISHAFEKLPFVFTVSCGKIRKSVKVILDNKIYNISDIICHPDVFTRSVEKTIEPRLRVLDFLLKKYLLKKPPALSTTFRYPNQKFFNRYIVPFLGEVEFRSLNDWSKEFSKSEMFVLDDQDDRLGTSMKSN